MKALDEHMSAGRLDPEEYGQRVAQASVARTREGLDELFVDLPEPHPFPPPQSAWSAGPSRPRVNPERVMQRLAGESTLARILLLLIAGVLLLAALPFVAVGALLVFVVLPILGCGGWRGRAWQGRGWAGRRW
jgi:hypothetical protein